MDGRPKKIREGVPRKAEFQIEPIAILAATAAAIRDNSRSSARSA